MTSPLLREQLQRRAEYTHKFNTGVGRYGWLRLTPAYSLKIVEELIANHPDARRILDPFCGTGTTVLCAAYQGHESVTADINPFLIWLTKTKTAQYSQTIAEAAQSACRQALDMIARRTVKPVSTPPIFNIERWWNLETLGFLRLLRAAIDNAAEPDTPVHDLLLVAFCRTLIELSQAAFNHQSMSFRNDNGFALPFSVDMGATFAASVQFVLCGALENPTGTTSVVLADARRLKDQISGSFDLVITSPPYVNRMSYIRELRPYMYWLGFLKDGREAGELDWKAIGGTWGIATSRLMDWERPERHFRSTRLTNVLDAIARAENKHGSLLANYVAKYFDDMWTHFRELPALLAAGAEAHYIVGNSTFYGTLVATEQLYAEMLSALGFSRVECRPLRKRNSNKALVEFDVVARWK